MNRSSSRELQDFKSPMGFDSFVSKRAVFQRGVFMNVNLTDLVDYYSWRSSQFIKLFLKSSLWSTSNESFETIYKRFRLENNYLLLKTIPLLTRFRHLLFLTDRRLWWVSSSSSLLLSPPFSPPPPPGSSPSSSPLSSSPSPLSFLIRLFPSLIDLVVDWNLGGALRRV